MFDDFVFPVAVRAQRRLRDTARHSLPVHTGLVLLGLAGVAHGAGIGRRGAESLTFGLQKLVGAAVAQGAIGRSGVAALGGEAVSSAGVGFRLIDVAVGAGRLGKALRMGDLVVTFVAGVASQSSVRAFLEFLSRLVTAGASRRFGSLQAGGARQNECGKYGETEPRPEDFSCPVRHGYIPGRVDA